MVLASAGVLLAIFAACSQASSRKSHPHKSLCPEAGSCRRWHPSARQLYLHLSLRGGKQSTSSVVPERIVPCTVAITSAALICSAPAGRNTDRSITLTSRTAIPFPVFFLNMVILLCPYFSAVSGICILRNQIHHIIFAPQKQPLSDVPVHEKTKKAWTLPFS